jgi:hypothetical protein
VTEKWSKLGAEYWTAAQPIFGTDAETYLRGRGISRLPGPDILRFHPAVEHPKLKRKFPALIAIVTGAAEPSHNFTFLQLGGTSKAKIDKAEQRRTFGASKMGVVMFAEPSEGQPLIIGEGIETTLTALEATGLPGCSCLGTSGLRNVEWSAEVREVILLAENDDNGANQRALAKVCPVMVDQGLKVRVASPPDGFKDFNDLVDPAKGGADTGGLMIAKMVIEAAPEWKPKRGSKDAKAPGPPKSSQASFLVELATTRCDLFCDPAGEAYASFMVAHSDGAHRETHRIRSQGFNEWLLDRYYADRHGAPSSEGMSSAVKTIAAKARFDGDRREVYLRAAPLDGKIYLDMCDPQWRAIEIDTDGFRVVDDPPVHFRRTTSMLALPTPSTIDPKKGIARLKEVLRLRDDRDLVVIVAWLLAALAGRAPYAIIIFLGEPGATKTSAAYAVRSIVDPNASPLRTRPKEPRDVYVAATHALIVGYNNLSSMPDWLSDILCTVSEGSGDSRRGLFSNADESLIIARSPFLITSIENVIRRGDLAQRTLFVHLASVPDDKRVTEEVFKAKFKRAHADLLGALCAAASVGLRREKTLKLDALPRLATFYHWAVACESALWSPGEFGRAFAANAQDATEDVIEAETAASVFRRFMAEKGKWEGAATDLLAELVAFVKRPVREAEAAHARAVRDKDDVEREKTSAVLREARETSRDTLGDRWPKAPHALTGKLKRASPALSNAGIRIEWPVSHNKARIIRIEVEQDSEIGGQEASAASKRPEPGNSNELADARDNSAQTEERPQDASVRKGRQDASEDRTQAKFAARRVSPDIPLNSKQNPAADGQDASGGSNPDMVMRIVEKFDAAGFRIVLTPESAVAVQDLSGRKWSREPPPDLMAQLNANADAVARWIEHGGKDMRTEDGSDDKVSLTRESALILVWEMKREPIRFDIAAKLADTIGFGLGTQLEMVESVDDLGDRIGKVITRSGGRHPMQ